MFRAVPLSVITSFSLYIQKWYMSYTLCWQLASRIRMERVRFWSCPQAVRKYFMTSTIAVCTVKNSWWWTEELPETCRVLFQNKFEKLVNLFGFITRIYDDARSRESQKPRIQFCGAKECLKIFTREKFIGVCKFETDWRIHSIGK